MNLNIETQKHDDYYEIKVGGELDVYTVPDLEKVLTQLNKRAHMMSTLI